MAAYFCILGICDGGQEESNTSFDYIASLRVDWVALYAVSKSWKMPDVEREKKDK